jgi:hypothetical protein
MAASLENGPSGVARFRIPATLDWQIRQNLRPGETFSHVTRGLLESWAEERLTPLERKETVRLRQAEAKRAKKKAAKK